MPYKRCLIRRGVLILALPWLGGCAAKVPEEVVELSYTVGEDLSGLQASYRSLIATHFDNLRSQRNAFIDTQWRPLFLERFVEESQLVSIVTNSPANDLPEILNIWVEIALDTIEARRATLIDPINQDEAALLRLVDQAFANLIWANTTITSHLNSIRKVQEVEDRALTSLNLKGLRDQIDAQLLLVSQKADSALTRFKQAENVVDKTFELPRIPGN